MDLLSGSSCSSRRRLVQTCLLRFRYRTAYVGAEAAAKKQGLGVWSVQGGIQRPGTGDMPLPPHLVEPVALVAGSGTLGKQIGSFARAQELLKQGNTYLDLKGDGWRVSR